MKLKRIMVDMSATLIHHGHTRLLKRASEHGDVIVGLTTDEQVLKNKGYKPELSFESRKEILEAFDCVSEIVPTPWLIDKSVLKDYNIDILIHGDDNSNLIEDEQLKLFPRTSGVSSTEIRKKAAKSLVQINNKKLMLTPGPAAVLYENIENIKPIFGRGDDEYTKMADAVVDWVKCLSGQDEVVFAQGSATFGLELASHSFVFGKVLLISTGYYSDRLARLLPSSCSVKRCKYDEIETVDEKYDWVLCAYTETSIAFKVDLPKIRKLADDCGAKLFVDATGSIGLEEHHSLADLMAFSSCKGLLGLTGAAFVAYKQDLIQTELKHFYFNLETHKNKLVTGPYHAIASLYGVIEEHNLLRERVIKSKDKIMTKWNNLVRSDNQPLLCTYIEGEVVPLDENIVLYTPRSELEGSVICHFGEIHAESIKITERITVI